MSEEHKPVLRQVKQNFRILKVKKEKVEGWLRRENCCEFEANLAYIVKLFGWL